MLDHCRVTLSIKFTRDNLYVTLHGKTRLIDKSVFRGFEVTLKPFENPISEGLKPFGHGLETIWKRFETLWKPFWNALKPFWNALKPFRNRFEMLWNPLETLSKCFETLWKPFWYAWECGNTLETPLKCFAHFEKPLSKKNSLVVCVHRPHAGKCVKAKPVIYLFSEMLFCCLIKYWSIYSYGKIKT